LSAPDQGAHAAPTGAEDLQAGNRPAARLLAALKRKPLPSWPLSRPFPDLWVCALSRLLPWSRRMSDTGPLSWADDRLGPVVSAVREGYNSPNPFARASPQPQGCPADTRDALMLTQLVYDFEAAQQRGEEPDIGGFLAGAEGNRMNLLRELVL